MTTSSILITGALGEMGHSLVNYFIAQAGCKIAALDLRENAPNLPTSVSYISGSVADRELVANLSSNYDFDIIFHLAAILSTGGEKDPLRAHQVNVEGSLNVLELARKMAEKRGRPVKVIFPSTIAIYGIPDLATKLAAGAVKEDQYLFPLTMYGINKLYVERLGTYFDSYFKYLENPVAGQLVDFRALRYPGILSADTLPTGGTSDYGPEMLHSAAQGLDYKCFVNPDTRIPFMVMPDAVKALITVSGVEREKLKQRVYNVAAFAPSAKEIELEIKKYFPGANISYQTHQQRLNIVESWPLNTDDSAARQDWNWSPEYNLAAAFERYLVPAVIKRYSSSINSQRLSA